MKKIIIISSLVSSLILYGIFMLTDNGTLLAFVLLGLLISFANAMCFCQIDRQGE
ncbi:hypothetical protein [Nitrosomonas sp.]|uniref:hypothetical protein n=1 Tax=Nitrosomonas sp. TaxID=42353 RepID=UPI0032EF352D